MRTAVTYVLDRSSSMLAKRQAAIDGIDAFLKGLRTAEAPDNRHVVTLVTFSHIVTPQYIATPLASLPRLHYAPQGNTALYDAIGDAIALIDSGQAAQYGDAVVLCVLTDGEENMSQRFTREQIHDLVVAKNATVNWTLMFTGPESPFCRAEALALGFMPGNCIFYENTYEGTHAVMTAMTQTVSSYSSSNAARVRGGGQSLGAMAVYADAGIDNTKTVGASDASTPTDPSDGSVSGGTARRPAPKRAASARTPRKST